jgi:hypothetical protein
MFQQARAAKAMRVSENLKATGTWGADQGEVWDNIHAKQSRMAVDSPTSSMGDTFDRYEHRVEDYTREFPVQEHQVGVIFAIDGTIEGMDLFDSAEICADLQPKLVRSFAIDAIESTRADAPEAKPEAATQFLDRIAAAPLDCYAGVGLGTDMRFGTERVAGGGLVHEDRLIHLAAFGINASRPRRRQEQYETRLRSSRYAQMRRRNRNDQ